MGMWSSAEKDYQIARQTAAMLSQAGIETSAVKDPRTVIWDKLIVNVGINAITALSGITNGQILDLESTRALSRSAVQEAASVARLRESTSVRIRSPMFFRWLPPRRPIVLRWARMWIIVGRPRLTPLTVLWCAKPDGWGWRRRSTER